MARREPVRVVARSGGAPPRAERGRGARCSAAATSCRPRVDEAHHLLFALRIAVLFLHSDRCEARMRARAIASGCFGQCSARSGANGAPLSIASSPGGAYATTGVMTGAETHQSRRFCSKSHLLVSYNASFGAARQDISLAALLRCCSKLLAGALHRIAASPPHTATQQPWHHDGDWHGASWLPPRRRRSARRDDPRPPWPSAAARPPPRRAARPR